MNITPRQRDCLAAVVKLCDERQVPVGCVPVGKAMGVAKVTAHCHLRALAKSGHLNECEIGCGYYRYTPRGWEPLAIDGPIKTTVEQSADALRQHGHGELADKLLAVHKLKRSGDRRETLRASQTTGRAGSGSDAQAVGSASTVAPSAAVDAALAIVGPVAAHSARQGGAEGEGGSAGPTGVHSRRERAEQEHLRGASSCIVHGTG